MRKINVIELFSGIGGFSLGLLRADYEIEKHYFSEINRHSIANYKNNFPNAKHIGSVKDVRGGEFGGKIDVITFGSPCQDFSLAGNRTGLGGERSGLIGEAIRVVREIRPAVFIWENVKGVFSSNGGADFAAILQAFTDIGGYRLEWQLLNTRWFLPQNRERIYLVGHLAGRSRAGVFPIGNNEGDVIRTERRTSGEISTTLRANGTIGRDDTYIYQRPRGNNKGGAFTECPTISANSFQENNLVGKIRRLTEVECERLQGFPDDWTKWGNYDGEVKEIARTNRYKMIGNAVTVDVVAAVAKRLRIR